jgi:hypothetical protein
MAKRQKYKRTNNDLQNIHIKQDMTVTGCCYQKSPKRGRFFPRVLAAILKMAEILKTHTCSSKGDLSLCQMLCLYHYPFRSYQH